jgi:hypothetical protein
MTESEDPNSLPPRWEAAEKRSKGGIPLTKFTSLALTATLLSGTAVVRAFAETELALSS